MGRESQTGGAGFCGLIFDTCKTTVSSFDLYFTVYKDELLVFFSPCGLHVGVENIDECKGIVLFRFLKNYKCVVKISQPP